MKVLRVQYTVRDGYAEQNKRNVAAVMQELREQGRDDIKYAVYLHEDGRTFMHFIHFNSAEAEQVVERLAAFARFRDELRPNLEAAPKFDAFTPAHASWAIFPETAVAA
jgi:hypothetical protein